MEDSKGDECVPAALVSLRELAGRRTTRREGEMADEPGDDGAGSFPEGACQERLGWC